MEETNRLIKRISESVHMYHTLYFTGVLLAKESKSKPISKQKPDTLKFSVEIFEQVVDLHCNPTNINGFKAFLQSQPIQSVRAYLKDIYCESQTLSQYIQNFVPFTLEKWIEIHFQKKPDKINMNLCIESHMESYDTYYEDEKRKFLLEVQPRMYPNDKMKDVIKLFGEKEGKCREALCFIEEFNIEKVEKKIQVNQ